ncbi:hypothetical protein N7532_006234 [Penicillium argentinense]|uniref:JmjC domain-containing protein n=1 Tax=Penicillium argentinense TaxID=1131581 RepID=A0A9W9FFE7_9EURO|nr:uncharacterized protein N7532_006234 [Penicillium argentinense]KAJ5099233.1 hypothetical protein N7532_006234 [Penicillium argentinense]
MRFADRISCDAINKFPREDFENLVYTHVIHCGKSLIVDGFQQRLDQNLFSADWLRQHKSQQVFECWRSTLGHDLDLEDHFTQLNAWTKAPFTIFVVEQKTEQKPGDLILVPPLAAHQVWNRGTRNMKVAWNRTTVETLEWAVDEKLSRARLVCRDEQYKNKAIIFYTVEKYSNLLQQDPGTSYPAVKSLWADFEHLYNIFTDILMSERFSAKLPAERKVEFLKFTGDVTCSYCHCNIFNRFLTCPSGFDGEETYDICMDCYVFGRSY